MDDDFNDFKDTLSRSGVGLGRFGFGLGSVWDRFGIGLGSVWGRFGIDLGSVWDRFGVDLGSIWIDFGTTWDRKSIKKAGIAD